MAKGQGRGGRREGSGRPTMFPGRSAGPRITVRLTAEAFEACARLAANIGGTTSDAVEYAIRHTTKLPIKIV